MKQPLQAVWEDALPGLIAAGLLSAAEVFLIGDPSWQAPLFGLLSAGTVYAADHRVRGPDQTGRFTWIRIGLASAAGAGLLIVSPRLSLPVCSLYVLLALGYVLPLPGSSFRFQDHPWLRVLLICLGWGAVPLILVGLPWTSMTWGFCLGTTGLFFSAVFFSDLADIGEDRRAGRRTPVQTLSPARVRMLIGAGSLLSCTGYLWAGLPELMVPALLGLGLLPCLDASPLLHRSDLLLLWPGVVALLHLM